MYIYIYIHVYIYIYMCTCIIYIYICAHNAITNKLSLFKPKKHTNE